MKGIQGNPWDQFAEAPDSGFAAGDPENTSSAAQGPHSLAGPQAVAQAAPPAASANPWDRFPEVGSSSPPPQMQGGFADELPQQASSHMSAEDEAAYVKLAHTGTAEEMQAFQHQRAFVTDIAKLRAFTAARDAAKAQGRPVDYSHAYELPDALPSTTAQATQDGISQGGSLGTSDEIHGFLNGVGALVHGKSYTDEYDRTVDRDRAQLGADQQQHGVAFGLGSLAGGLVLPMGLEKSGLTASLEAVGLAAGRDALVNGATKAEARIIAARAVTKRLVAEGSAYGGAYGAGSADGGPGQRLLGGAVGAAEGAAGGLLVRGASQALAPVARGLVAGGNSIADNVRNIVGSVTPEGAADRASGLLRDAASGSVSNVLNSISSSGRQVSGARPTLAEVAGDSGLAGFQRGLANTDLRNAPRITERQAENALVRTRTASDLMGEGIPQEMQDYAGGQLARGESETAAQQSARQAAVDARLSGDRSSAEATRYQAETQVDRARRAIGPEVDREATGSAAREAFDAAHRAAKQRTSDLYNDPRLLDDEPVQLRPIDPYDITVPTAANPRSDLAGFQDQAVKGLNGALPEKPQSLLQFVRSRGGIKADAMGADDLRHSGMGARDLPSFINKHGLPADNQLEAAVEAGFVPQGTTMADFLDHLSDEHRGLSRMVRPEDMNAAEDRGAAEANRAFWQKHFAETGLDPLKMSDAQWRDFHDHVSGAGSSATPRTLGDMESQFQPGSTMGPFQKTLGALRDRFFGDGGAEAPAYVRSFFNDVMNADTVGIRTLEGWERHAYDMAAGQDPTTAGFLRSVGRAIGAKASIEGGPGRRAALDAARAARREQGRIFETGNNASAFARDRYGNPAVGNTELPTRLLRQGAPGGDAATGLSEAIGPAQAEPVVRQELRRVADEKGVTTEAQARALAVRYGDAAKRFPGLQADLNALQAHGRNLDAARAAETAAARASATADEVAGIKERSALHEGLLKTPLARIANVDVDPATFVGQSLAKRDDGRQLRALYGQVRSNPDAANGFRRALGDYIKEAGEGPNFNAAGERIPSPPKTRAAINAVVSRAGDALSGQQKMVLKAISRELEQVNFAQTASKPAGSETAINKSFAEIMGSVPLGPHAGGARLILKAAMSSLSNKDEVRRLITQAILDPDFAATLLKRPTPKHWEQVRGTLMGRKTATALTLAGQPAVQTRVSSVLSDLSSRAAAQGNEKPEIIERKRGQQQAPGN